MVRPGTFLIKFAKFDDNLKEYYVICLAQVISITTGGWRRSNDIIAVQERQHLHAQQRVHRVQQVCPVPDVITCYQYLQLRRTGWKLLEQQLQCTSLLRREGGGERERERESHLSTANSILVEHCLIK